MKRFVGVWFAIGAAVIYLIQLIVLIIAVLAIISSWDNTAVTLTLLGTAIGVFFESAFHPTVVLLLLLVLLGKKINE